MTSCFSRLVQLNYAILSCRQLSLLLCVGVRHETAKCNCADSREEEAASKSDEKAEEGACSGNCESRDLLCQRTDYNNGP